VRAALGFLVSLAVLTAKLPSSRTPPPTTTMTTPCDAARSVPLPCPALPAVALAARPSPRLSLVAGSPTRTGGSIGGALKGSSEASHLLHMHARARWRNSGWTRELAGRSISVNCSLQPAGGQAFLSTAAWLALGFFFCEVSTGIKNLWDRHLTCSPLLVKMTAMTNHFF
jgi:hypothetical protein